jgi:hypothetical protein
MAKPVIVKRDNRIFECHCAPECNGKVCGVLIYEIVRPKWKIFRTKYRSFKAFWIEDFSTIREGVESRVDKYLHDEWKEQAITTKWEEIK